MADCGWRCVGIANEKWRGVPPPGEIKKMHLPQVFPPISTWDLPPPPPSWTKMEGKINPKPNSPPLIFHFRLGRDVYCVHAVCVCVRGHFTSSEVAMSCPQRTQFATAPMTKGEGAPWFPGVLRKACQVDLSASRLNSTGVQCFLESA